MGLFLWLLFAAFLRRTGALLLRSHDVPVGGVSLSGASTTEMAARLATIILDDVREDMQWESPYVETLETSSGSGGRTRADKQRTQGIDGFARARHANSCTNRYHAPGWDPMVLSAEELKAKYILHGKSGSSEIRQTMKHVLGDHQPSQDNFTLFTIVRDPLSRSVSSFWENLYKCVGFEVDPDVTSITGSMNEKAVAHYEKMISMWERKAAGEPGDLCMGPHGVGQRSRMPDAHKRPVKFVGTLAELSRDWKALGRHQIQAFGVGSWPELPEAPARAAQDYKRNLLNTSLIPASLAQRVCTIFRDDYCCFQLPIPSVCNIEC